MGDNSGSRVDDPLAADLHVQQLLARISLLEAQLLTEQISKQIWMERFQELERARAMRRTDPPYVITVKSGGFL